MADRAVRCCLRLRDVHGDHLRPAYSRLQRLWCPLLLAYVSRTCAISSRPSAGRSFFADLVGYVGACGDGSFHGALCTGVLPTLRRWQLTSAAASKYGVEALARCNARIAVDVLKYSEYGLVPADALANSLRPFQRLCSLPAGYEVALCGSPIGAVVAVLQDVCRAPLQATLDPLGKDACAIVDVLLSDEHIRGLLERLLLNCISWSHTIVATARSQLFCGLFVMTACANHSCRAGPPTRFPNQPECSAVSDLGWLSLTKMRAFEAERRSAA